jgi:hypothetical protein
MEPMIGQIFKEFPFWLATVTVVFLGILLIIWLLLPLWVLFIQWNTGKMKDESEAPRPKGLGFPVRCFLYIVPLAPALTSEAHGSLSGRRLADLIEKKDEHEKKQNSLEPKP